MGKRRRGHAFEDQRWKDALEASNENGLTIQMDGLMSPTGTVFARVVVKKMATKSNVSLQEIVKIVVNQNLIINKEGPQTEELFRLGSVWILPTRDKIHPQNAPKWERIRDSNYLLTASEDNLLDTVRVHCRPARFPSSKDVSVIFDNSKEVDGFVLVNKPGHCPSHATVDNAVENALAVVQSRKSLPYASLPQRLDTETFGLLLIATKPQFASYISRLLESKTKVSSTLIPGKDCPNVVLSKRYRCLVVISGEKQKNELEKFYKDKQIVTHYLDSKSPAPKIFQSTPPEEKAQDSQKQKKWQICQLRLDNIGSKVYPVSTFCSGATHNTAAQKLAFGLWGNDCPTGLDNKYVIELEIELLTGRTHQIRGQLSSLKAPIVGDPLYGGFSGDRGDTLSGRSINRMALQCCALQFPRPKIRIQNNGKEVLEPAIGTSCQFALDRAWWTDYLELYDKNCKTGE